MVTTRYEARLRMQAMRRLPLFAGCTREQLARIDRLGARIDVAAGRRLTVEGTTGRECFFTLAGTAVASRDGAPVGVIGPGSVVGEMALLDDSPRTATVVTATPMQLLVLDRREFARLCAIAPSIATAVDRIASGRRPTHA
jgi:CRP/FNR family cyclic AMP-dependent transcriptional regulator